MKLVSLKSMKFAGRQVEPGDAIEATEHEARIVKALGWASDPPSARRPKPLEFVEVTPEQMAGPAYAAAPCTANAVEGEPLKRKRGRPPGPSKAKQSETMESASETSSAV